MKRGATRSFVRMRRPPPPRSPPSFRPPFAVQPGSSKRNQHPGTECRWIVRLAEQRPRLGLNFRFYRQGGVRRYLNSGSGLLPRERVPALARIEEVAVRTSYLRDSANAVDEVDFAYGTDDDRLAPHRVQFGGQVLREARIREAAHPGLAGGQANR